VATPVALTLILVGMVPVLVTEKGCRTDSPAIMLLHSVALKVAVTLRLREPELIVAAFIAPVSFHRAKVALVALPASSAPAKIAPAKLSTRRTPEGRDRDTQCLGSAFRRITSCPAVSPSVLRRPE
jgi:hypothetical protein